MATATLAFPQALAGKYRPTKLTDFIGLEKQKKVLSKLVASPRPCALTFVGQSGCGKTSLAYAFASEIGAEVHHVGSQQCKVEQLQELVRFCQYIPLSGGMHVCVVDEADVMSDAAQKYLLSKLDSFEAVPNTIWIFTCNNTDRLEERFLSRTMLLEFNSYGACSEIAEFLARVWKSETDAPLPSLKKIVCGNIRESLSRLEVELLAV
ncbi:MAG TPA: AAA family ATPase [Candidatus Acidoferrales bacterium]|nr:AAA family ATPase [Candidatus Acidoferrales bacterium]